MQLLKFVRHEPLVPLFLCCFQCSELSFKVIVGNSLNDFEGEDSLFRKLRNIDKSG